MLNMRIRSRAWIAASRRMKPVGVTVNSGAVSRWPLGGQCSHRVALQSLTYFVRPPGDAAAPHLLRAATRWRCGPSPASCGHQVALRPLTCFVRPPGGAAVPHLLHAVADRLHPLRDLPEGASELLLAAQLPPHRRADDTDQRSEQQLVALPEVSVVRCLPQHPAARTSRLVQCHARFSEFQIQPVFTTGNISLSATRLIFPPSLYKMLHQFFFSFLVISIMFSRLC